MKKIALAIIALSLTACSAFEKKADKPAADDPRIGELRLAAAQWSVSLTEKLDDGWLARSECDSTLWNGLACAAGVPIKIELAEYSPGELHRRPAPSCWTKEAGDQGARSTISSDMILGYEACLWRRKDLDGLKRLASYGEAHDRTIGWQMGEPYPEQLERVLLRPSAQGRLGTLIERLSDGDDKRSYRLIPELYAEVGADFEEHLQVVGMLIDGEADRLVRFKTPGDEVFEEGDQALEDLGLIDIPKSGFQRLKDLARARPQDALIQCVLGIYTGDEMPPITLLLDPGYQCPSYVRSDDPAAAEAYCEVHKLLAADCVLRRFDGR